MATSNLEALNELIQKIKTGERRAKSNLEALNLLCVIAGGTGATKSNLEALNELLTVFSPGGETQEKAVTITENGTTEITPDAGYTLSKAVVNTAVPSKPEQTKAVTITENGTTEITPDAGKVLSGVSVSVNVAGGPSIVTIPPVNMPLSSNENILTKATDIDLGSIEWGQSTVANISYLFRGLTDLKNIKWGDLPNRLEDSLNVSGLFQDCKQIETIDLSLLNITLISSVGSMFSGCTSLKNVLWGGIKVHPTSFNAMFLGCESLTSIDTSFLDPEYNETANINSTFMLCNLLETVDLSNLKTSGMNNAANAFYGCNSLTNVVFENNCFSNARFTSLDLSHSPLSHDCAVDIFNKLATRTNSPTLKLSTTTKGYLTDAEIAVATGKGWVIA